MQNFGPGGVISGVDSPVQLASGGLISGEVGTVNGLPSLDSTVTFNAASSPFFVSPPSSMFYDEMGLTLRAAEGTVTQTANGFMIDAGGGSDNFASLVPEPETYALMLAGLCVMAFVARRRRSA